MTSNWNCLCGSIVDSTVCTITRTGIGTLVGAAGVAGEENECASRINVAGSGGDDTTLEAEHCPIAARIIPVGI